MERHRCADARSTWGNGSDELFECGMEIGNLVLDIQSVSHVDEAGCGA